MIADRLHKMACHLDSKAADDDVDSPDEMVFHLVKNAFVDDSLIESVAGVRWPKGDTSC